MDGGGFDPFAAVGAVPVGASSSPPDSGGPDAIDVGGPSNAPPAPAAPVMAIPQADGSHRIRIDRNSPLKDYAGQVMGVSDPAWLPKGIALPTGTRFPVTLNFDSLPQPASYPIVAAPPAASAPATAASAPAVPAHVPLHQNADGSFSTTAAPLAPAASPVLAAPPASPTASSKSPPVKAAPQEDFDPFKAVGAIPVTAQPNPGAAPASDFDPFLAIGAKPVPASPATAAPPVATPPAQKSGFLNNIGAAGNEALSGLLGLPVDVTTGIMNLGTRAGHAVQLAADRNLPSVGFVPSPSAIDAWLAEHTGGLLGNTTAQQKVNAPAPQITNPVGGTASIDSALGVIGADPRTVVAATPGEALTRSVSRGAASVLLGGGVAGAAAPLAEGTAAAPVLDALAHGGGVAADGSAAARAAFAARAAGVGGAGGATGYAARQAAPPEYGDLADTLGNIIGGGVAALGDAGLNAVGRIGRNAYQRTRGVLNVGPQSPVIDPATGQPVVDLHGGMSPSATQGQRDAAAQMVLKAARQSPGELASTLDAAPGPAIPGSVPSMGQQTGNLGVLGLERRLRNLNREPFTAAEAANHEARLRALSGAGGPQAAADAARVFFAEQTRRLRGYVDQLDRARDTMGARIADQLGGSQERVSVQELGEAHQAALEALRKPVRAAASALLDAVDPDGTLALRTDRVVTEAKRLMKEVNPRMGGGLVDAERGPLEAAAGMRSVELFSDLRDLDSNLSAAQRAIRNDPKLGAESKPYRRVTALRDALDAAMEDAAGSAAERDAKLAAAGHIDPSEASGAKFAKHLEVNGGEPGGGAGQGSSGAGQVPPPGMARDGSAGGSGGAGVGGPGRAGTDRGLASAPTTVRLSRASKPQSLLSFLVARGGIRDDGGDLAAMGLNSRTRPTLIRAGGMSLDMAREAAIEAGYFPWDNPDAPSTSDVNMILDAIAEEAAGRKVYRPGDGASLAISAAEAKAMRAHEERVSRARDAVGVVLDDMGERLTRDGLVHATHLVADLDMHPQQAVEDALKEEHHAMRELETKRLAMGPQTGIPGAVQEALPIEATSRLKPNFGAGDRQALRAAHRVYADYKSTYRRGVVGDILAHGDLPTGFKMPGGEVPRAIFRSGPKGASAIDAFIKAAGSPEKAVEILGDYPAMVFRRFAERDGVIDPDRAATWLADNHDVLRKLPGMAEKFANAATATKQLQEASARGQAALKAYQDSAARHFLSKDGEPVEPQAAMSNLLKSPTAPEDARQMLRLAGTNQSALDGIRRNYVDYIIQRTRSAIEAGTSGTKEIQSRAFQNLAADPKIMKVSRIILGNDGADLMQKIAKDIELANRSANATRIPGSPATMADLHAEASQGHGSPSILSQVVLGEMGGEAAAGALHAAGPAGAMMRAGVAVGNMVLNAARAAGLKKVEDLAAYAVLHPEVGRLLVSQVKVTPKTPILRTLTARIGDIGVGTAAGVHGEVRQ